jgi:hypothetical protein
MSILFKRIVPWFRQMTDREPMEVDVPAEFRRSRLGSRGILFARLDQPSVPRGRRVSKKALEAFPMITAAFYGPDDLHASKLVLAHIPSSVSEPGDLERWVAPDVLGEAKVLEDGVEPFWRSILPLHFSQRQAVSDVPTRKERISR